MRLEAIEKEADMYRGEGECYIHAEKTNGTSLACVMAGDKEAVAQAVYSIVHEVACQLDVTFPAVLKMYKRAYKQFGEPKRSISIDD